MDSTIYTYNAGAELTTLTRYWGGESAPYSAARTFSFTWDTLSRLRKIVYPATAQSIASGNIIWRRTTVAGTRLYAIPAGHNRLTSDSALGQFSTITISYRSGGSRIVEMPAGGFFDFNFRGTYYDGLGRLSGFDSWYRATPSSPPQFLPSPMDCRWNADGQLSNPCPNGPRLAFDGVNVISSYSANSTWHILHGPGTDFPLVALDRFNASGGRLELFYVTDGRGRQYAVADSSGRLRSTYHDLGYRGWQWAGGTGNAQSYGADRMGTAQQNPISFFRNRAYDQNTGRYTQEDPIGVAGGLNLYTYAGNNPVTFTDPFGLSPDCPPDCDVGDAADLAAGFTPGVSSLVDGATLLTGTNPITGDKVGIGGRLIALAGFLTPASGGEMRGAGKAAKPALSGLKKALGRVHEIVGKLPKGKPGKFGSPQRGTSTKGYRLDPGHPNRPAGDPEAGPHINYWDYTGGSRGNGGTSGAVPIE